MHRTSLLAIFISIRAEPSRKELFKWLAFEAIESVISNQMRKVEMLAVGGVKVEAE